MRRLYPAAVSVIALAAGMPPARADRLPDPRIPGFHFPESEATVTAWITDLGRAEPAAAAVAYESLHRHAWGLWTALTAETGEFADGQPLRVFETWATTEDLLAAAAADSTTGAGVVSSLRPPLRPISQLQLRARATMRYPGESELEQTPATERIVGFTKYDPTAAQHIVEQQLLKRTALDALLTGGAVQVPPFPTSAIVVKSLFQLAKATALVDGRYYALKVWQGPPTPADAITPDQWTASVWLDLGGDGEGGGAIDSLPSADGSSRTAATTYPISSLIHYRLNAADAAAFNASQPGGGAEPGDYALLVAMHVAGREIARWTWQTFWWTPAPDEPPAPSSAAVAALRPDQLQGPARHYAMAVAYSMLSPEQPYTAGGNHAPAVYAYNPWLEARLGPADLPDSQPGLAPDGTAAANNHGVESNCMSCHAQATYNPGQLATAPRFTGARYVDLGDPRFVGTLQTEFLWALARHAQ
jgi:hypothetical protein